MLEEQQLDVRRDKRERIAFAATNVARRSPDEQEEDAEGDQYEEDFKPSLVVLEDLGPRTLRRQPKTMYARAYVARTTAKSKLHLLLYPFQLKPDELSVTPQIGPLCRASLRDLR